MRIVKPTYVTQNVEVQRTIYVTTFVSCPLEQGRGFANSVGLTYPSIYDLTNLVKIRLVLNRTMQFQRLIPFHYRYPSHFAKFKYPEDGLVVCGTPLYGNFSNTLRLVEYIEIYRKMGAKKFYIYNDSATKNVSKILNYYEDEGIVKVFDWPMDRGI